MTAEPVDPVALEEMRRNLADPMWRLSNLYWITVKGDDTDEDIDKPSLVVKFRPNAAQQRFIRRMWHRNLILKARQLGFTTLVSVLWLDHALFNANQRCGVIAQDREAAEVIFRDKVKFAYDHLPESLRNAMPLKRDSAVELLFGHNNSSIRVATSMRSGTIHRLHVSEFGKICAHSPDKAREVVTGSIPAVPLNGVTIIESTSEGRSGEFYEMAKRAQALNEQGKDMTKRDYRFHFYAWWQEPNYRMDPLGVVITDKDRVYFEGIELSSRIKLDAQQRAWYVATRDTDFSGDESKMWQEYPSTPDEAFQVSTEGVYYASQLQKARVERRIGVIPHRHDIPVNTFWDIGQADFNSIWFHQNAAFQNCFIRSYQNCGEYPAFYATYLREMQQKHGYVYGTHYLPHDAEAKHATSQGNSYKAQLEALLPGQKFVIVPRIQRRIDGINMMRSVFSSCFFDEEGCADGLVALSEYRKHWNKSIGAYTEDHVHDSNSNYADAIRQFAQGYDLAKVHLAAAEPEWKRNMRAMHSRTRRDPYTA